VAGLYAVAVAAFPVEKLQPVRDGTVEKLPVPAVGRHGLVAAEVEPAVAKMAPVAVPLQASALGSLDVGVEALSET
jgi:hypothetical protein